MKTSYDKYYKTQNYFGKPYTELMEYFKSYQPKCTVLDLGCGQGRDAIALGKLGFKVVGVDKSQVGLNQMLEKALENKLNVVGINADMYNFSISSEYDIVLLDSMLHFYKNDINREKNLVNSVLNEIKEGGLLCNCMQKGDKREKIYKSIIKDNIHEFKLEYETYMKYPDYKALYHLHIVRKIGAKK